MIAFPRPHPASASIWAWRGVLGASVLIVAVALLAYVTGGEKARQQALADRQLVEISLNETLSSPPVVTAGDGSVDNANNEPEPPPAVTSTEGTEAALPTETEAAPEELAMPAARIPPQEHPEITAVALPPVTEMPADEKSLPSEPQEDLIEKTGDANLPIASKDGLTPMAYYARAFKKPTDTALVAVVVTGLGQLQPVTQQALGLPPEVSLSFSPYARELSIWTRNARRAGHETYLDLPLGRTGVTDAGPLGLTAESPVEKLRAVLKLQAVSVGVVSPPNEIFSLDEKAATAVFEELRKRGLALIASGGATGFGRLLAASPGQGMSADRALPAELTSEILEQEFAWIEQQAKERRVALLVVPPVPAALEAVGAWIKTFDQKKLKLAPASALFPPARPAAVAGGTGHGEKKPEERHNPALEKKAEKKEEAKPSTHH